MRPVRWIATKVFLAGEPNPHPAGTAVVRRRVRAIPPGLRPSRRLFDVYGAPLGSYLDRRTNAITGQVWVRRSLLRLRRVLWALWLILTAAAVVHVAVRGNADEQVVRNFSVELLVLLAVGVLLFSRRLHAVIDHDEVGIRGS